MKITETSERPKLYANLESNDYVGVTCQDGGDTMYFHICYDDKQSHGYIIINLDTGDVWEYCESMNDVIDFFNRFNALEIRVFDKDDIEIKLGRVVDSSSYYLNPLKQ